MLFNQKDERDYIRDFKEKICKTAKTVIIDQRFKDECESYHIRDLYMDLSGSLIESIENYEPLR